MAGRKPTMEEIQVEGQRMQMGIQQLATKINELEGEHKEHTLVCECLGDVAPDRKCWRMIGGVLVERSVKEVLPAVKSNKDQLGKMVEMLKRQLGDKLKEMEAFKAKYGVQSEKGGGADAPAAAAAAPAKTNHGVLV